MSRSAWVVAIAGVVVAAGVAIALGLLLGGGDDDGGGGGGAAGVPEDGGSDAGGSDGEGARQPLDGFGEVAVTIAGPEGAGDDEEWCLLLAETSEQRQRGLMEVTDPELGGYDGMLFRFPEDVTSSFYMRNTPMPLSIAFIDQEGQLVSTADMEPCEDRDGCPLYPAAGPYRWAVEVPQGGLERLGIVAGATFADTGDSCGPAPGS